ncbi:MAG: DUF4178 domain-containing protein [Pseudomonadota bacterium]
MATLSCPNCGNPLTYTSPALPVKICDRCQSVVVRHDDQLERIGEAAVLPFDVSPIQIGSMGLYEGQGFTIVGRIRWGWSAGSWNEWLALFDDGSNAWLGEAMGDFMLLREADMATNPQLQSWAGGGVPALGSTFTDAGVSYTATDVKSAHILASEGELPFRCTTDWTIESVDFRSSGMECASFQRDEDGASFYTGKVVSLGDLRMHNVRAIEGWAMPELVNR